MPNTSRLPGPVADRWDWQLRGACRDLNSSLFFHPEAERGPRRHAREERAKSICLRCPVLVECRQHALSVGEPYGVWGAMTERERQALLDRRRQAAMAR